MGISNFSINFIITSSHNPLILIAILSKGVSCKLTMTNFLFFPTILGISAAGVTVKLEPKTKHKSEY